VHTPRSRGLAFFPGKEKMMFRIVSALRRHRTKNYRHRVIRSWHASREAISWDTLLNRLISEGVEAALSL
jgi:hypothetical protein